MRKRDNAKNDEVYTPTDDPSVAPMPKFVAICLRQGLSVIDMVVPTPGNDSKDTSIRWYTR